MFVFRRFLPCLVGAAGIFGLVASSAAAQTPNPPAAQDAAGSAKEVQPCPSATDLQPPPNSPTLLRCIQLVFHPDGSSVLDPNTYIYYLKRQSGSRSDDPPGVGTWVPYNEQEIFDDFNNLLRTGFLDDLWVERIDEPYANGVKAEHIVYHMEERQRLKVVDYTGSKEVEISKIESALKEQGITIRYDTFIDDNIIKKVKQVIKDLYAEKAFNDANVE